MIVTVEPATKHVLYVCGDLFGYTNILTRKLTNILPFKVLSSKIVIKFSFLGACFNSNSGLGGQFARPHCHHQGYTSVQSRERTMDRTAALRCHAGIQGISLSVCVFACLVKNNSQLFNKFVTV